MDERALEDLRGLAAQDRALEHQGTELRAADAEVARIRGRAEEIAAFFSGFAEEEAGRAGELRAAEEELAGRRDELAAAEAEAARADGEQREAAEKAVARARDHVAVAESRVARAKAAAAELEARAAAFEAELPVLDRQARGLQGLPEATGDLVAWASHAHAELFVAAGQIDLQRERVIREANELASALTGEPTYGSTVAQALERVERLTSRETA